MRPPPPRSSPRTINSADSEFKSLAADLPDIHRALKKITVSGDVACIQLTIG
jgi:hypothetical protein